MGATVGNEQDIGRQDHWVVSDQGRIFVRTWAPRQHDNTAPIILFHDSLGCVELWRGFPAALSARTGRAVIAYDRLGFGRSDPHPRGWSVDFVREEAERWFPQLRRQLDIAGFVAMGHSVGGAMAAHCAASFAEDCRALVTMAAQAFVEDRTLAGIQAAEREFAKAGQLDRLKRYHGDKAEWALRAWIDSWHSPAFDISAIQDRLPQVRCPTLVIHGAEDEYGSSLHPQIIGRGVSGRSAVHVLPGCRHLPHREQEEVVLALVADHLSD
jgi:pimeloyl-ACP methyl ester carboxylesterase